MRKTLLSLLILPGLFLASCDSSDNPEDNLEAKGGKQYGGELTFMSIEKVVSLIPAYAADVYSSKITDQIYEPLVQYDLETMTVVPAVAESFTVNDDATVYTFKIRQGLKFHADECFGGEPGDLTAEDVKYTFDLACSGVKDNQISYLVKSHIKGGEAYFNKSKNGVPDGGIAAVKAKGNEVEITLEHSFPGFERVLANSNLGIVSKKVFETYGSKVEDHPIGSGPFKLDSRSDDKIELSRNANYWKKDEFGNQLPFMSKITMTYAQSKENELTAFRKGEVDLVLEIPVDQVQNILGTLKEAQEGKNIKHKVDSRQSLSMTYVSYAHESEEFSDVRLRQAFNLAINR